MLQGTKYKSAANIKFEPKRPTPPSTKPAGSESLRARRLSSKPSTSSTQATITTMSNSTTEKEKKQKQPISIRKSKEKPEPESKTKQLIHSILSPCPQKLVDQYTSLFGTRNKSERELRDSLKQLRYLVLKHGIPNHDTRSGTLRGQAWKLLLGVYKLDAADYISTVQKGPSHAADKISNDVFRTLATDLNFTTTVSNDCLSRVLNAFVWKAGDRPKSRFVNTSFGYVQGMNVLLAPFVFVMPELDAFYCYTHFILQSLPLYVQPALEGVHCGLKLVDKCFHEFDNQLFSHLLSLGVESTVYAFPCIYF